MIGKSIERLENIFKGCFLSVENSFEDNYILFSYNSEKMGSVFKNCNPSTNHPIN